MLLLPLLMACTPEPPTETAPPPPYTWEDTAVVSSWDTLPSFEGAPPRNLIMISIDTLRKDAIGFYGGEAHTPFLDRMLSEGVHLDNHIQCSDWTYASTTCTLAGRYNIDNRYMPKLNLSLDPLPAGEPFLATWLGQAGFTSMLLSPNEWLSPEKHNTEGYDQAVWAPGLSATELLSFGPIELNKHLEAGADRWFMHLHFLEPHAPYDPPADYLADLADLGPVPFDLSDKDAQYNVNGDDQWETLDPATQALVKAHLEVRYRGEVEWLDDQLAAGFDELEAQGLLDDALVVVWSDHGEQFWEHGEQTHAWSLHPEENHAILTFWSKNIHPQAWDGPTSSVDMVPTLLHLWELELPPEVTGVPLGAATTDRARFAATASRDGVTQMVRREDQTLHFNWRGEVQRFDLLTDPEELHDLFNAEDPSDTTLALWEALRGKVEAATPLVSDPLVWPEGLPH